MGWCSNSVQNNLQGNGQGICNNCNDPSLVAYTVVPTADFAPNTAATGATAAVAGTPFYLTSAVVGNPQNTVNAGTAGPLKYTGVCAQNPILQNEVAYNVGFLKRQYYTSFDPFLQV